MGQLSKSLSNGRDFFLPPLITSEVCLLDGSLVSFERCVPSIALCYSAVRVMLDIFQCVQYVGRNRIRCFGVFTFLPFSSDDRAYCHVYVCDY
jgi:hypothetical protein